MISESWVWNWGGALLLGLIATTAMMEAKSSSLVPKSLLLWPAFVILAGLFNLMQGGTTAFFFRGFLGLILILCGIQAAGVNLRRLGPWPSGMIWLGLALVGLGMQFQSLLVERAMGFIWIAIGITKVMRERSASLEAGTPFWILLLYLQAILLASYR